MSDREISTYCWRKKFENRCVDEVKKKNFTLPESSISQGGTDQCQERTPQPAISPTEKSKSIEYVYPTSPAIQDIAQETHFFLTPSRILRC